MYLDTDDHGFDRTMIDAMVRVFVEQLTPPAVRARLSATHPSLMA
jgi:hypothetical protein